MGQQESQARPEPKELISTLSYLSTYEITRYAKHYSVDISAPPSHISPLHYLAQNTNRRKVLGELMDMYGIDPLMTWNGNSLLKVACEAKKWVIVEMLMKRIPIASNYNALVVKDIWRSLAFDDEDRRRLLKAWDSRVRNSQRLIYLQAFHRYQALPLPTSLAHEVVLYI